MLAGTAARGSRTVALTHGNTGAHASINGGEPQPFHIKGELSTTSLATALAVFSSPEFYTTVLIIGTRDDGQPGWNHVDEDKLPAQLPQDVDVLFFSEAQALSLDLDANQPTSAWLILATAKVGDSTMGSARWWIEDQDGIAQPAHVQYLGKNYGQIFTFPGDNLGSSPAIVAAMVEALANCHPDVRVIHVWSQDGLTGNPGFQRPDGIFWQALRRPADLAVEVVILPRAFDMLVNASSHGIPMPPRETPTTPAETRTQH